LQRFQTASREGEELDAILSMINNPVRRDIIKRLSQEPSYPLQLSKELGVGQQLIAKHLDALEEAGIVTSSLEPSPNGPSRKEYALKKSVALSFNFAPNLFSSKLIDLSTGDAEDLGVTKDTSALANRIDKILRSSKDQNEIISLIGKFISDVDQQLSEVEDEKAALLYIRNLAMSEAAKRIKKTEESTETRRIMYHILDTRSRNVSEISESVNLREDVVRKLLDSIAKDLRL
jgi:ArsR family transcriptional regulator